MRHRNLFGACALALAALAGCYTGGDVTASGPADPAAPVATSASGTDPSSVDTSASGLPCDVAEMLARSCASCHGSALAGGATNRILTYADLMAPSRSDPTTTVAAMSIQRMQNAQRPMPPTGAVPSDLATLQAWVTAGRAKGACTSVASNPASSGTSYSTPTVCTSGQTWTRGNRGSSAMRPGLACIACHDQGEGPSYSAAGTLYPTAHEPDDCYGATGATVEITDATGQTFTMSVNSAGNFYLRSPITPPYRAKVVSGSKTRVMATAQTNGDCNTCHTEQGDTATKTPGRVMAP